MCPGARIESHQLGQSMFNRVKLATLHYHAKKDKHLNEHKIIMRFSLITVCQCAGPLVLAWPERRPVARTEREAWAVEHWTQSGYNQSHQTTDYMTTLQSCFREVLVWVKLFDIQAG